MLSPFLPTKAGLASCAPSSKSIPPSACFRTQLHLVVCTRIAPTSTLSQLPYMPSSLSLLLTLAAAAFVKAQDFTSNATSLTGTWSTGSGAVVTGPVSLPSYTAAARSCTAAVKNGQRKGRWDEGLGAARADCPTSRQRAGKGQTGMLQIVLTLEWSIEWIGACCSPSRQWIPPWRGGVCSRIERGF